MADPAAAAETLRTRHLRIGWTALLAFLSLGLVLEALHGFKLGWYLDVGHENRRLMLTLGHAHGTLLGLVHVALAASASAIAAGAGSRVWLERASPLLTAATVLLPGGFLLGGLVLSGADPGPGVLLVPVGGLALVAAIGCVVAAVWSSGR